MFFDKLCLCKITNWTNKRVRICT